MSATSSTFPYTTANDLAEFTMVAGTNQELVFDVFTSASVAINITGAIIVWKLAPYGQTTSVATTSGSLAGTPNNRFTVYMLPAHTTGLGGKYIQQYTITDTSGSVFAPSQGIINIVSKLA